MRPKVLIENGGISPRDRANLIVSEHMACDAIDRGAVERAIASEIEMAEAHAYKIGAQTMRNRIVERMYVERDAIYGMPLDGPE